jgi:hypothetical protein
VQAKVLKMDGKAVVQDAQGNIIYPCGYKGGAKERSVSEPVFEENEVTSLVSLIVCCQFIWGKQLTKLENIPWSGIICGWVDRSQLNCKTWFTTKQDVISIPFAGFIIKCSRNRTNRERP